MSVRDLEKVSKPAAPAKRVDQVKIDVRDFDFYYGTSKVLHGITLAIPQNRVTALIGPSGCGKSTFLRSINRMNDIIPGAHGSGSLAIDGVDVYGSGVDVVSLRRRVGMVFQKSNPFPKSIYDNVAYGLRIGGVRDFSPRSFRRPAPRLWFCSIASSSRTSTSRSSRSSRRCISRRRASSFSGCAG